MAWCPNCKYEYKKGIIKCADCGADLVDSLEDTNVVTDYEMDHNDVENNGIESDYEVVSLGDELKKEERNGATSIYQRNEDKAEEFKSSAYVLTFVGIIGVITLFLIRVRIIPIQFGNELMIDIVMGGLFVVFFILGILSFQSARKYKADAIEENSLTDEINKWCNENLTKDSIQAFLQEDSQELSEELLYFQRTEQMKRMITEKFINLQDTFLETVIENYYQKIYEENELL